MQNMAGVVSIFLENFGPLAGRTDRRSFGCRELQHDGTIVDCDHLLFMINENDQHIAISFRLDAERTDDAPCYAITISHARCPIESATGSDTDAAVVGRLASDPG
jgi:hypothetical protein